MRYLLLIAGPATGAMANDDLEAEMAAYMAFQEWATEQGWLRGGEALHPAVTARTVAVRDGERIVTDGPFAETKEQIGGYYEIDVPSLDDAIEVAARIPGAAIGSIEIRPIVELG
jgi:hypothetical protein